MPKRILLAEDDEDNRDLVKFVMKRSGMEIELLVAENGQEAVELALKEVPDLVLMDMQMPVMDGFQATQLIKANGATAHIPVIAFTAQAKAEDRARTLGVGCVEHYSKPMDPQELLNVIRKYLNE
ncbi:MAG: response regulator [Bacteroidetes bacterium]|nr:MAG: response regulator [Bacteroidota bacterium]